MNNMLLITSRWDEMPTFRMIPMDMQCPYQEAIYIPDSGILVVITKNPKSTFQMVPKLDDNGAYIPIKNGSKAANGSPYKQERKAVDSYQEYYIEKEAEIISFVSRFAMNATFSITEFLKKTPPLGEVTLANPAKIQETASI